MSPVQWTATTNFPETATRAIDFGPGGTGPLTTARNLDGRGVRVIIVGDKGKGGAEVYDSQDARYEEWWSKKWGPQVVRTRHENMCYVV
jgi:fatty acid synthase subunit alpha